MCRDHTAPDERLIKMERKSKHHVKVEYDSPVILTIAILSFAALILNMLTGGKSNTFAFSVYRGSLASPMFYVRLICHVLGHADFAHFFGNMSLLLIIGPTVERRYGSLDLLVSIIFTAVVSGVVHCLVSPGTALLGASGIVFMCIFLSTVENIGDGKLSLTFVFVALFYFGQAIYEGIFRADNVSQLGHIVGGLCGIACGYIMRKRLRK